MYQIEVQGQIGARWRQWFEDLSIHTDGAPGATTRTVLTGAVADQAALLGFLQKLYTLGLPLLLVKRQDGETAGQSSPQGQPNERQGEWRH
jgi:hypothetical protein